MLMIVYFLLKCTLLSEILSDTQAYTCDFFSKEQNMHYDSE